MSDSIYSFSDLHVVFSHPAYGSFTAVGQGIGDMSIEEITTKVEHDTAADGSIMVSIIKADNGRMNLNVQQTSNLNKWFQGLYNYLKTAPTSQKSLINATVRAIETGTTHICTKGAFENSATRNYQAQGQRNSWGILFVDIQTKETGDNISQLATQLGMA